MEPTAEDTFVTFFLLFILYGCPVILCITCCVVGYKCWKNKNTKQENIQVINHHTETKTVVEKTVEVEVAVPVMAPPV